MATPDAFLKVAAVPVPSAWPAAIPPTEPPPAIVVTAPVEITILRIMLLS